ncbi:unnamed protein product [Camellia sinensis]
MMDHLKPKDPSMACYFLLNIMIILSSSLFPVCASEDILRAGESLNSNQTLTSAGGNFALGFFSPGNSTNRYIGIWYKTISKQTVIWVANSENPLAQNSTAVFRLGDDGNLVIFYGRGQVVYFVEEGDEIYLSCSVPGSSNKIRAMLTPSGQAQVLLCEQSDNSWVVAWKLPVVESKCDFYGQCAPFSSCEQNGLHPFCSCLQGFEPKDQNSLNLGNWTGGCARKMALTCDLGDWFFKFERTKLPDYSISLGNMTVSQCESKCRDNCSCTAYAYANMSGETTVHCMNWFGDLMDLKGNDYHGKDLYVRLHGSDQAVAISAGLLLISSFGYVLRMRRLRSQETIDGDSHELDANSSASVAGPSNGELLSFSLRSILAATDNFSEVKQLGEGGYASGNLPEVQEVAIKKLSKKSLQGTEEFMNELKLIAKLQHQNLVRLLGCCVEQEEKILIYEYMCNGSLDKLLFCPSKQANLDWSKQFRIIEGIAQGWAWENWKEGSCLKFIDPSIRETCDIQEALKCIAVGLLCVQEFPRDRPTRYIAILMRSNENVSIPSPKEPAFSTCRSSNTVSYPSQTSSSYSNNE